MDGVALSLSDAWTLHVALDASRRNPDGHPLLLALWRLWCPVAAWWWRAGARPREDLYRPHPVIRAVEDYARDPRKKLRDYLKAYGLEKLADEARKYIDEVKTARQRLPHVPAPETLPTFPGGKIPLDRRFGIRRELEAMGGEKGFLEYVRTWAFLIDDWRRGLPFPRPRLRLLDAAIRAQGMSRPLYVSVWAWTHPGTGTPWALFLPTSPPAHRGLWHLTQSADRNPWPHMPQIWQGDETGRVSPGSTSVPAETLLAWMLPWGREVARWERPPVPLGALQGEARCRACPFRHMCFVEFKHPWKPAPQLTPEEP